MIASFLQVVLLLLLVVAGVLSVRSFGINREYERAVLFRLGRVGRTKGPGWYWLIPLVDRVAEVDLRAVTISLDTQETVTRDGVAVKVNAVLWFHINDPIKAVTAVEVWRNAVVQAAETGMRGAIGQSDLDQLLKERQQINMRLMEMLTQTVARWGVGIDAVEIRDLDIPDQMQRAIAREAEAVRDKRARIIRAEGEEIAAATLAQAAAAMGDAGAALDLRRLQAMTEIGVENNSLVVAMVPTELLRAASRFAASGGSSRD
ncbi:MAG TPA: SPFH domain-containing protein [Acetobacteraceae bacterium]|jgi:regulator of protease activity HflC (stomatin/prohibitin superfamily)|nr:SPFH domain-containing protein [Acetobacteraceae bacterium]